jgi:thiamine biosynthesis lipoprotein
MGTYVEVISDNKEAIDLAFSEIKRIESLLSKYNPQSEISLLNKQAKAKVSPETFFIINKAKEFYEATQGAFDITVGALLKVWGFDTHNYRRPMQEEIAETLKLVGLDKVVLDEENRIVEFKKIGMIIDLGAIAKGYAVDCAIKRLKEKKIRNALINAGGDIYCLGEKFNRPWQVGIKDPYKKIIRKVIKLKDKAVATSGDYENYFLEDNKIYSHIFNPKTGFPVDSKISSITIVADDCLTADALATALFVLGIEKSESLLKRYNARIEDVVFKKMER